MDLEQRIKALEERNARVEANKAWERNPIRLCLIVVITYGIAVGYLYLANTTNPLLGAIVPCLGFLLSTLSFKFIRSIWQKRKDKANDIQPE